MEWSWKGEMMASVMAGIVILAILVNCGIVLGFQMMLGYPLETPQEAITQYSDYNILDQKVNPRSAAYLLAAPGKENRLVVTGKHFLMNRHEVLLDQEVGRKFSAELKADAGTVLVRISESTGSRIGAHAIRTGFKVPVPFVLWTMVLIGLECVAWRLFRKLRNG